MASQLIVTAVVCPENALMERAEPVYMWAERESTRLRTAINVYWKRGRGERHVFLNVLAKWVVRRASLCLAALTDPDRVGNKRSEPRITKKSKEGKEMRSTRGVLKYHGTCQACG